MAGFDVFLSHAGWTKPLADHLCDMLQHQLGLAVFLDKYMAVGGPEDDTVLGAANSAHVGLVLFSQEVSERAWPLRELGIFASQGSLLPALVPPLSYEDWTACLGRADVAESVRRAALRTVMMISEYGELLEWKHRVCLGVVRALVAKAVSRGLPNEAWAGEFRVRVKVAAERLSKFSKLTVAASEELREKALALAMLRPSPPVASTSAGMPGQVRLA